MKRIQFLWLIASVLSPVKVVFSKRLGAPPDACAGMTPRHQSYLPQTVSSSPYQVVVNSSSYSPNSALTVTIRGGQSFLGFLIEARRLTGNTGEPIGFFTPIPNTKLVCGGTNGNGLTHSRDVSVTERIFAWTAPSAPQGHLQFRATVVKSFNTFWVGITSPYVQDPTAPAITTPPMQDPIKQIVTKGECGEAKGCLSSPGGCVESDCDYLLTYRVNGDHVDFEMSSKTKGYISVGFSEDRKMGDDSVIDCIYNGQTVSVSQSFNYGKDNVPVDRQEGLSNMSGYYYGDRVACRFRRKKVVHHPRIFSLDKPYYILLARGDSPGGIKQRHSLYPGPEISSEPIDVKDAQDVSISHPRYPLAKAHGFFMTLAWVFFACFGVLTSRYYKPMWPNAKLCREKTWFAVHRFCMVTVLILTCLAFILIFAMVEGYSTGLATSLHKAHPILGITVTILVILNPLLALCRCKPKDERRPIFNWVHWGIGTVAHILAVVNVFIGMTLPKAQVLWYAVWILVFIIIFHCVVELTLEVHQCCTSRENREKQEQYEMEKATKPRDFVPEPEPAGHTFKKVLYIVHAVVVGVFTFILIVMILV